MDFSEKSEDMDGLAIEYGDTGDEERKFAIRAFVWESMQKFAYNCLLKRLHHSGIPESRFAEAQDLLDSKIFRKKGFEKIHSGWDPEKGRTFENYFKRAIVMRCGDIVRGLRSSQSPCNDGAGNGKKGLKAKKPTRRRGKRLQQALKSLNILLKQEHNLWEDTGKEDDVSGDINGDAMTPEGSNALGNPFSLLADALDALEEENGPGNPNLGREARAVFELIYKAYIQPDDIGEHTQRMAETRGGCPFDRLKQEYFDDQQLQTRLDDAMVAASRAIERTAAREESQSDELFRSGYTVAQVAALEAEGRNRSTREGDASRMAHCSQAEERYIKLCARFIRLRRVRQMLLEEKKKYEYAAKNSTWTRSETETADILKMSQPTVHRRLDFAEDFIRRWGMVNRSG